MTPRETLFCGAVNGVVLPFDGNGYPCSGIGRREELVR